MKVGRVRGPHPPVPEEVAPPSWRSVAKVVLVGIVVLIIVIVSYNIIDFNSDRGGEVHVLEHFSDGSTEPLLNSTYLGSTMYLDLPPDASVQRASLSISGVLPPSKISSEVGKAPVSVTAGDFDMDGYPDVAVANYYDDTLTVRFNRLGDALVKGGNYQVGMGPMKVLSNDLDADGDLDLVSLSEDEPKLNLLLNDGRGRFVEGGQSIDVDPVPSDMVAIDIEGDGDTDMAVISTATDRLTFYVNDGSGTFVRSSSMDIGRNPAKAAAIDMTDDGRTDLVLFLSQGNGTIKDKETWKDERWLWTVLVLKNVGGGLFQEDGYQYKVKKDAYALETTDINGDGHDDLIMANRAKNDLPGTISMLTSTGSGGFQRGLVTGLDCVGFEVWDPIDVTSSDMDLDGDQDLISLSKSGDSMSVHMNLGNGTFVPYQDYYVGLSPTEVALTDFDLDGDLDVVTSDWRSRDAEKVGNGSVSVTRNLRDGIFGTYRQFATGNNPRGIFTLDLDGDGSPEIATANYFSSTVSVLRNDGVGGFGQRENYFIGLEPYMVVLADFDRDGNIDAASADEANFRIILLESNHKGGFVRQDPIYVDIHAYPFSLRCSDVDGDGDLDLYTSNYAQKSVTVLFNDGFGNFKTIFGNYTIIPLGERMPYDALIEDVDGDGLKDLITVNKGDELNPTDTISVFRGKGGARFSDEATYKVGLLPTSAALEDLDGDGDLDIATSDMGSDSMTVLMNDGNGVFRHHGTYDVGDRPQYVETVDFDHDGKLDLAVTNSESNDLYLFRNKGGAVYELFNVVSTGSYPYMISVNDLNGDGRDDLAITSVNTARVVVQGCTYYPSDVKVDVGADGSYEYVGTGLLEDPQEIDITDAISSYLREHGRSSEGRVPILVTCGGEGIVKLNDIVVVYRDR